MGLARVTASLIILSLSFLIGEQYIRINQQRPLFVQYKQEPARTPSPYAKSTPPPIELPLEGEKTAVVSGATGGLGTNIVEQLLLDGWSHVVCFHRKSSPLSSLKALEKQYPGKLSYSVVDMNDFSSIEAAIPENTSAFFHSAAVVKTWQGVNDEMYSTNVLGTRKLVDACLKKNVKKFILTSSIVVYYPFTGDSTITEDSPHLGESSWIAYPYTKSLQEKEVHAGIKDGLWATILNPGAILGKYDRNSFGRLYAFTLQGLPAVSTIMSFNSGAEIARAHVAAAKKGRLGENYILAGENNNAAELAYTVADLYGLSHPPVIPSSLLYPCAWIADMVSNYITKRDPDLSLDNYHLLIGGKQQQLFSSAKAIRELDYKLVNFKEAATEAITWWKEDREQLEGKQ